MKRSGRFDGHALVEARAAGTALVLDEPLSFWGGLNPVTGDIIDRHHPQRGQSVTGRVVVLPVGRGSSSSSTVLAEAIRLGTAPAGILLAETDSIIVVGALVAADLYDHTIPVVLVTADQLADIPSGVWVEIEPDGRISYHEDEAAADP